MLVPAPLRQPGETLICPVCKRTHKL